MSFICQNPPQRKLFSGKQKKFSFSFYFYFVFIIDLIDLLCALLCYWLWPIFELTKESVRQKGNTGWWLSEELSVSWEWLELVMMVWWLSEPHHVDDIKFYCFRGYRIDGCFNGWQSSPKRRVVWGRFVRIEGRVYIVTKESVKCWQSSKSFNWKIRTLNFQPNIEGERSRFNWKKLEIKYFKW